MRRVGILGGMGPEATIALMQRVVDLVPAKDDSDHVPLIIDHNTQVPSRLNSLLDGGPADPGVVLGDMAVRLRDSGAMALAMPCNTAHHYRDQINAAGLTLLDMVALAADQAREFGDVVGILGSPALERIGLYEQALDNVLYPSDQKAMLSAIQMIKRNGANDASKDLLAAASRELQEKGAVVQIIACTEFSLISDAAMPPAIDALDVLAKAVVAFSLGEP